MKINLLTLLKIIVLKCVKTINNGYLYKNFQIHHSSNFQTHTNIR